MRILRKHFSRFEPLNRQRQVGLGVLTRPPCVLDTLDGRGAVRRPCPTCRFMESLHLQPSDAHWDHEPEMPKPWEIKKGIFRFLARDKPKLINSEINLLSF